MSADDPNDPGNDPSHHTGKHCIEPGCTARAGTAWSPLWCAKHNAERLRRIEAGLKGCFERAQARYDFGDTPLVEIEVTSLPADRSDFCPLTYARHVDEPLEPWRPELAWAAVLESAAIELAAAAAHERGRRGQDAIRALPLGEAIDLLDAMASDRFGVGWERSREAPDTDRSLTVPMHTVLSLIETAEGDGCCTICCEILDTPENDNGDGESLGHTLDCPIAWLKEFAGLNGAGEGGAS